jgi:peptidase YpeB-like protein
MTRKLLVGAIVAGALTVTAGTAFALSQDNRPSSGAAPSATSAPTSLTTSPTTSSSTPTSSTSTSSSSAPAQLSADDAARIAQARYGGTVHEIEREVEHGRLEWKVELTATDGTSRDVRIDAVTGAVTRVDKDDDDHGDDHDRHGGRDDDDHDDD